MIDNEVDLRWVRLVLGWVTVSGFNSRCGKFISVRLTNHAGQLSLAIPRLDTMSTGQRAVMLCSWGVKAGMARVWWQVKLFEPNAAGVDME